MDDYEREAAERLFQRMDREATWLKRAYESGDVREEYSDLIAEHFEGMKQLGGLLFKLMHEFTTEETERHLDDVKRIKELLEVIATHGDRFREIYKRLPNKYDMYLATVETPPKIM